MTDDAYVLKISAGGRNGDKRTVLAEMKKDEIRSTRTAPPPAAPGLFQNAPIIEESVNNCIMEKML